MFMHTSRVLVHVYMHEFSLYKCTWILEAAEHCVLDDLNFPSAMYINEHGFLTPMVKFYPGLQM